VRTSGQSTRRAKPSAVSDEESSTNTGPAGGGGWRGLWPSGTPSVCAGPAAGLWPPVSICPPLLVAASAGAADEPFAVSRFPVSRAGPRRAAGVRSCSHSSQPNTSFALRAGQRRGRRLVCLGASGDPSQRKAGPNSDAGVSLRSGFALARRNRRAIAARTIRFTISPSRSVYLASGAVGPGVVSSSGMRGRRTRIGRNCRCPRRAPPCAPGRLTRSALGSATASLTRAPAG